MFYFVWCLVFVVLRGNEGNSGTRGGEGEGHEVLFTSKRKGGEGKGGRGREGNRREEGGKGRGVNI